MATLRIKSQWFREGVPRSPAQTASVLAFIAWRVTQNMLRQMREAGFDIPIGPVYFRFMREVLVFWVLVLDRMAHDRLDADARAAFTGALARRIGGILEESAAEWLGEPGAGEPGWAGQFIDQCNAQAPEYAEFGHGPDGPDFGFVRLLGSRIEALMPPKDRHWVIDQVMAIEVPQALEMVRRGFAGALDEQPRARRRAALAGD